MPSQGCSTPMRGTALSKQPTLALDRVAGPLREAAPWWTLPPGVVSGRLGLQTQDRTGPRSM